jgi:hypothetical protein
MVQFSDDVDIARYEPVLFGELCFVNQVLTSGGGGTLSGTAFTAAGVDFEAAKVSGGCVIYLRSVVDGCYEIISVDSATQLTVSVVRADSSGDAVAPPAATDVFYRVCSYEPQADEVGYELTEYFGIKPGSPDSSIEVDDILDTDVLRRASAFGVISVVYATLASRAGDENFWSRSLHYKGLFEKARERIRLVIDSGSDGVADFTRIGGVVRLIRD